MSSPFPVPSLSGSPRMAQPTRLRTLLLLALVALGCTDAPTRPITGTPSGPALGRLGVYAQSAALPPSGTLVVQVWGPGIVKSDGTTPDTLAFNIPLANGVASGSITVPAGPQRVIMVRAFNGLTETHRGSVTTDISVGANPTVVVTLVPLVGDVKVTVSIGTTIVIVRPSVATLGVGDTLRMSAEIHDQNGALVTGQVRWATLNPGRASVDTMGLVTMRDTGDVQIVATYGTVGGSAKLSGTPQTSAVAYQLTWNGSVSRSWTEPNNWTPHGVGAARVPTASDSVVITAGPANQPVIDACADQAVRDLVVGTGATLGSSCGYVLNVYRRVVSQGGIAARIVARPGATLAGAFGAVTVAGDTVSLADSVVAGSLDVNGTAAGLLLRHHRLQVTGAFTVSAGTVTLVDGDTLQLEGSVSWYGGDENGKLAGGVVLFRGTDFYGYQYRATGTNRLVFARTATGQQSISGFDNYSNSLRSGLQRWEVRNRDGVRICGYLTIADTVSITTTASGAAVDNANCGGYPVRANGPVVTDANTTVSSYLWELHDSTGTSLVAGGWSPQYTDVYAANAALKPGLAYQNLRLYAPVRFRGPTSIAASLTVTGTGADVTLGGNRVTVGQDFSLSGGALLGMTSTADTLRVAGSAGFNDNTMAAELTRITAGVLDVGGYFYAYGFNAKGTNLVRLRGTSSGTNYMSGMNATSYDQGFQELEIVAGGTVPICNAARVRGTLTVRAGAALTEQCGYSTLRIDGDLVTETGSTISVNTVQLYDSSGTQHVAGAFTPANTAIYTPLAPGQLKAGLGYGNLGIYAAVALPSDLTVTGNLAVSGAGSTLAVNGHRLAVAGRLDVSSSGVLTMTNAADSLIVAGAASFSGAGSESGQLTAGVFVLRGDSFCADHYLAAGAHKTVFDRTGSPVRVDCVYGGTPSNSQLAQVEIRNYGVTLNCSLYASGRVHLLAGARIEQNCYNGTLVVQDTLVTDAGSLVGNGPAYPGNNQLGVVLNDSSGTRYVAGSFVPHWTYFSALHPYIKPALGYHNVRLDRSAALVDSVTFDGDLDLINDGTILTLGGRRLNVRGSMELANASLVRMTAAADTLLVGTGDQTAHLYWNGGDNSSLLSGGVVLFNGATFYGPRYVAAAPNRFVFTGTASGAPISVQGAPTFGRMEIAGTRAVNLNDRAVVLDTLLISAATQLSGGYQLQLGPGTGTLVTVAGSDVTMPYVYLDGPTGTRNVQGRFRPANLWLRSATPVADALKPGLEYGTLHLAGAYQLLDSMTIAGDLSVESSTGDLRLNGHRLRVGGNADVSTGGVLHMTTPAESLQVAGHVYFHSDAGISPLSAGVLTVAGDYFYLDRAGSGASGTHTVVMNGTGTGTQDVYAAWDGSKDIRNLEIASTRTVRLQTPLQVTGTMRVTLPTAVSSYQLRVGGVLSTVSGSSLASSSSLELLDASGNSQVAGGLLGNNLVRFLAGSSTLAVRTGADSTHFQSVEVTGAGTVTGGALRLGGDLTLSTAGATLTLPTGSAIGNNANVYGTLTFAGGAAGGNYLFVQTGGTAVAQSATVPVDFTNIYLYGGVLDNRVGSATSGFRYKATGGTFYNGGGTVRGSPPATWP